MVLTAVRTQIKLLDPVHHTLPASLASSCTPVPLILSTKATLVLRCWKKHANFQHMVCILTGTLIWLTPSHSSSCCSPGVIVGNISPLPPIADTHTFPLYYLSIMVTFSHRMRNSRDNYNKITFNLSDYCDYKMNTTSWRVNWQYLNSIWPRETPEMDPTDTFAESKMTHL